MPIKTHYDGRARCILALGECESFLKTLPDNCIDLTITSPPYFMGKEYDNSERVEDFTKAHESLLPEIVRVTKPGGSICWQVGYHVRNRIVTPLDYLVHSVCASIKDISLRNRIIWSFGHGLHGTRRFSGRHETVLWYTKGEEYYFDLDSIRVPQKYPGKLAYSGIRKGELSGNPLGKNPGDVWEIPNVKARHIEKTEHPCQFPVALALRLVRALSPVRGRVLDPFVGSGSTGVAALSEKRQFVGIDKEKKYFDIAWVRCNAALANTVKFRALDKPIQSASPNSAVARKPSHFV